MPKAEKVWESVPKAEKVCQKLRKCAKRWESVSIVVKVCQKLRKYEKVCQKLIIQPNLIWHVDNISSSWERNVCTPSPKCCLSKWCKLQSAIFYSALWQYFFKLRNKCLVGTQYAECCLSKCNAIYPNAWSYTCHNWFRLLDDISGPTFGCVCVKAIPRTACCCQKQRDKREKVLFNHNNKKNSHFHSSMQPLKLDPSKIGFFSRVDFVCFVQSSSKL